MAKPTPDSEQQALIDAEIAKKQKEIDKFQALIPVIDSQIVEKTKIDDVFKSQFNWYNDIVIGNYETEREALNGVYVTNPITNLDIENVVFTPTTARLFPDPGNVDVKRISQFDGTPTSTSGNEYNNELYWLSAQQKIENLLVNGLNAPSGDLSNIETVSGITNNVIIQTIELLDTASVTIPTLNPGEQFIIKSGSNYIPVEVISSSGTQNGSCDLTQYTNESDCTSNGGTWTPAPGGTITAQVMMLTSVDLVTVNSGASVDDSFSGFNNAERINKTSVSDQGLMDHLVAELQGIIGKRQLKMSEQNTALSNNEDPDLDPSAATNISTSDSFLTTYLLTTDISDIGIASLSSERSTRTIQANNRVTAINSAFTGQTENFYDQRYTKANDRAQIRRGTLTEINKLELSKDSFTQQITDRTQAIASLQSV